MQVINILQLNKKIFFLLIIKMKNIHKFNELSFSLWILSTKKIKIPHWHILPRLHPQMTFVTKSFLVTLNKSHATLFTNEKVY